MYWGPLSTGKVLLPETSKIELLKVRVVLTELIGSSTSAGTPAYSESADCEAFAKEWRKGYWNATYVLCYKHHDIRLEMELTCHTIQSACRRRGRRPPQCGHNAQRGKLDWTSSIIFEILGIAQILDSMLNSRWSHLGAHWTEEERSDLNLVWHRLDGRNNLIKSMATMDRPKISLR